MPGTTEPITQSLWHCLVPGCIGMGSPWALTVLPLGPEAHSMLQRQKNAKERSPPRKSFVTTLGNSYCLQPFSAAAGL